MKYAPLTFLLLILLVGAPVMAAADCPAVVKQALRVTDNMCLTTGENQACYGNIRLQAKPFTNTTDFTFDKPGDQIPLREIKSLQLSPMALDTGEWGVALMHIQANLPAMTNQNVMLLAFGDVSIENTAPMPTATDLRVIGQDAVNVRWMPNLNARAVAVVQPGQEITAVERLVDSSWLRINLPNSGDTGWIKGDLVESAGDLRTLNVSQGDQPNYRPMQAFTFSSGSSQENCAEIPKDGLLIQTPEGAGEIRLWINRVVVKLGSTVYFQAEAGGDMVVTTLEGHATVEALGVSHTAVAGTRVRIKMNADLTPAAPPSLPEAYRIDEVAFLPVGHLQREIVIHAPLTAEAVALIQQQQQTQTVVSSDTGVAAAVVDTVSSTGDGSSSATLNNGTVQTVVNTVIDTGSGDAANTGSGEAPSGDGSSSTSGGSGGGLLNTVLQLPCILLHCK